MIGMARYGPEHTVTGVGRAMTRRANLLACLLAGCSLVGCSKPAEKAAEPQLQFARASGDEREHGERLGLVLGCVGCHGKDLAGEDWSEPGFGSLWTANLTRAVPAYSDEGLKRAIASGRRKDGTEMWEMPSHLFTAIAPADMAALVTWLRSVPPAGEAHPLPVFQEGAHREMAAGKFKSSATQVREEGRKWPPDAGARHALARYIVRATCAECHGLDLHGGQPNPTMVPRPDLRLVGAYDRQDFRTLLRTGKAAGNREVSLMSEVARGRYVHLTDAEVDAIFAYLQAVAKTEDGVGQ
jgi:mono/diheme cytochrome c family protein